MRSRWPLALAALVILGSASRLVAQARPTSGARAGRPIGTHPRSPRPPINLPLITSVHVPPLGHGHRPVALRSTIFGLIVFDPAWFEVGGELPVSTLASAPPGALPTGGLQLDVEPRRALVYVDGALAGRVDQFSGYYHHLDIAAGWHSIDFIAPDYEPMTISVSVTPGQTTTYRGSLNHGTR
jgi:hypothetical protein